MFKKQKILGQKKQNQYKPTGGDEKAKRWNPLPGS